MERCRRWQARRLGIRFNNLCARLAAKDFELQQVLAKYRSAADEFEQARARLRKEVAKDVERGRRAVLGSFLEVLDNLDRALAASTDKVGDPLVQGVSLVQQQFLSTLESLGVVRVNPMGEMFDPTKHEAVTTLPAGPDTEAGRIVGVVKPGYSIGEDLLRPALVAVAG